MKAEAVGALKPRGVYSPRWRDTGFWLGVSETSPGASSTAMVEHLPSLNALLNATSAVLLLTGYGLIRRRHILAHRTVMIGAFCTSVAFLISYLYYHYHHGVTRYTGIGWLRPLYFAILGTHTALAGIVVPLVLVTLFLAIRGNFSRHRAWARWTFPLWLYVSVTGVLVYLMLYHLQ